MVSHPTARGMGCALYSLLCAAYKLPVFVKPSLDVTATGMRSSRTYSVRLEFTPTGLGLTDTNVASGPPPL